MDAGRSRTDIVQQLRSFVLCWQYGYYQKQSCSGFQNRWYQIDVVRIIFQTSCPYFSILTRSIQTVVTVDNLIISAIRFSIGCTYTESFILISSGETETITISFQLRQCGHFYPDTEQQSSDHQPDQRSRCYDKLQHQWCDQS